MRTVVVFWTVAMRVTLVVTGSAPRAAQLGEEGRENGETLEKCEIVCFGEEEAWAYQHPGFAHCLQLFCCRDKKGGKAAEGKREEKAAAISHVSLLPFPRKSPSENSFQATYHCGALTYCTPAPFLATLGTTFVADADADLPEHSKSAASPVRRTSTARRSIPRPLLAGIGLDVDLRVSIWGGLMEPDLCEARFVRRSSEGSVIQ